MSCLAILLLLLSLGQSSALWSLVVLDDFSFSKEREGLFPRHLLFFDKGGSTGLNTVEVNDIYLAYRMTSLSQALTEQQRAELVSVTEQYFGMVLGEAYLAFESIDMTVTTSTFGSNLAGGDYNYYMEFDFVATFDELEEEALPSSAEVYSSLAVSDLTVYIISYLWPLGSPFSSTQSIKMAEVPMPE